MKVFPAILITLFFYSQVCYSQDAQKFREKALELFNDFEWSEAAIEYNKAIEYELRKEKADKQALGADYNSLAMCNMGVFLAGISVDDNYNYVYGDTSPVIDNLNKSAECYGSAGLVMKEAQAFILIAQFYRSLLDYKNSVGYMKKAASIYKLKDPEEYSVSLFTIAGCYTKMDDWEQARENLEEGIKLYEKNLGTREEKLFYSTMLASIGNTYVELGRYDEAMQYFDKGIQQGIKTGNIPAIVNCYTNMAIVHTDMGQFDRARESYQIARNWIGNDHTNNTDPAYANIHRGIAHIHFINGKLDSALILSNEANKLYKKYNDIPDQVGTCLELSQVYCAKKDYEKARENALAATEMAKNEAISLFKQNNTEGVQTMVSLAGSCILQQAYIFFLEKDYKTALEKIAGSIKLSENNNERKNLVNSYSLLGMIYYRMGDYPNAIIFFNKSISLIKEIRRSVNNPRTQRDYLATMLSNYQNLAMIYYRQQDFSAAFYTTEISSATIFGEQVSAKLGLKEMRFIKPVRFSNFIPDNSIILKYQFFDKDTALCLYMDRSKMGGFEFSPEKMVNEAYTLFGNRILNFEDKSYINRDSESGNIPEQEENKVIQMKFEAMIRYYRFLLSGNTGESRGAELIEGNPQMINGGDLKLISELLYKYLVKPVEPGLKGKDEIVILPTGILGFLPFETLSTPENRFLCETFNIRYQQSLSIANLLSERQANSDGPILAFGGADYSQVGTNVKAEVRSSQELLMEGYNALESGKKQLVNFYSRYFWMDLPGSLSEVKEIAAMKEGSVLITGVDASETTLKKLNDSGDLAKYRIIHFATHGIVIPEIPELSAVVLSPGNDKDNDGYLNMNEIYSLNLRAEMVNLSACETGLGKIYKGEGVVGLTQAFLLAGSDGVSVSLWSVDDQSTSIFMQSVYKKVFSGGNDFSEAMNHTRQEFIKGKYGENYKSPKYWAPFVYYGITGKDKTGFRHYRETP